MAQLRVVWVCDTHAVTLEPATVMVGPVTPVEVAYTQVGGARTVFEWKKSDPR